MLSLSHGARHGIQVPRSVGSWVDYMQVRIEEWVTAYFTAASSALHLACPPSPASSSQLPAPLHPCTSGLRMLHPAPSARGHTHLGLPPWPQPAAACLLFRPSLWPREGPLKAKSLGSTTRCRLGECCCCTTLGPLGPLSALLELWTWPHPRSDQISQIRSID